MAEYVGMEAVVRGIQKTLEDNMGTAVSALNDAYDDEIEIEDIAAYEYYDRDFQAGEYPACVIEAIAATSEEEGSGTWEEARHDVWVTLWATNTMPQDLVFKMMRYAHAIKSILANNPDLGIGAHITTVDRILYSEIMTRQSRYRQGIRLEVRVMKEEEF